MRHMTGVLAVLTASVFGSASLAPGATAADEDTAWLLAVAESVRASDPISYNGNLVDKADVPAMAKVGRDIDPAAIWADSQAPAYAGSWVDHSRGSVAVFMVKGSDANTIEGIRARIPPYVEFEFVEARYSLAELNAVQDAIEAQRETLKAAGIPLASTSIRTDSNTVEVGLVNPTATHVARLTELFGDAISVIADAPAAHADACPQSDCLPAKGGMGVLSLQAGNPCTLGFGIRVTTGTDYYGNVTAGHCFRVAGCCGEGHDWMHEMTAQADRKIGDAEKQTWYTGAWADVGLIDYSTDPTDRNNFWTNLGTTSMTSVALTSSMQLGDYVCRVGRTSAQDCGFVSGTDASLPSEIEGVGTRTIHHQWVVAFDSSGGDSGGPYFSGSEGWGIHTHSLDQGDPGHPKGWFSPLNWTTLEYLNRWGVSFQYCVTNAC